jgi:hypothetical protein
MKKTDLIDIITAADPWDRGTDRQARHLMGQGKPYLEAVAAALTAPPAERRSASARLRAVRPARTAHRHGPTGRRPARVAA